MAAPSPKSEYDLGQEIERLRAELREAQEVIRAIQSGEVDAVVVSGPSGDQVYTLKGAEHGYRELVEAMNEGAATLSGDGTVLYCNQRLADIVGVSLDRIIGTSAALLLKDSSTSSFRKLLEETLAGDAGSAEVELEGQGHAVPVYVSARRMIACEPAAICIVVSDLTEHRRRDELIASGMLARSILHSVADPIAVCDEEGRVVIANPALIGLCGHDPSAEQFDEALPLSMRASKAEAFKSFSLARALTGEAIRGLEVRFSKPDGTAVELLLSSARVSSPSGVTGCVLTLTDVTERMQAEEALIRSEKLASVGRMAAAMAHEINNPLAAVMNTVFIARENADSPDKVRDALEVADEELRRVAHLTQQTLGFYRESHAAVQMRVSEVLDSAIDLLRSKIKTKHANIRRQYEAEVEIVGIAGELRQVFANLLTNSLEAIADGGTISVSVSPSQGADREPCATVTVTDNGPGISPDALPRLFEPLFTSKKTGTGLGLWVSKQIVDKHGGCIHVQSNAEGENRGTTVSVMVPVNAVAEALQSEATTTVSNKQ